MKVVLAFFIGLFVASIPAAADFADFVYVPPAKSATTPLVPAETVEAWLALPTTDTVLNLLGEVDVAAKSAATKPGYQVAAEVPVDLPGEELFAQIIKDGSASVAVARVVSVDALAVRLRVDLAGLADGDALWQVDAATGHAFGPYTAAQDLYWLPVVAGAETLLVLESDAPSVSLAAVSHFYVDPFASDPKGVSCPQSIACEEDETIQDISTATGMIFIPVNGQGTFQCSGTLLNAPDSAALEPYFITAHHCFDGDVDVPGIEVIWDFRPASCGGAIPSTASLPRSRGEAILAENACLDGEFIELDGVPVGARGRAWLGWDSRTPSLSDTATVIHHPAGTSMKISSGPVSALAVTACFDVFCANQGIQQTQLQYEQGITEGGSSGSGALYSNHNYRLFGMLSNGPVHNCNNPPGNIDNFASFYRFYPEVQPWLKPSGTPGVAINCDDGAITCPAKAALGASPALLAGLRTVRDTALSATPSARVWVDAYYAAAPAMAEAVRGSDAARDLFSAVAVPVALAGHWLGGVSH